MTSPDLSLQPPRPSRTGPTRAAAWVVLVVGVLVSIAAGAGLRVALEQRTDTFVDESARFMASEVEAALQRQADLVESARAYAGLATGEDRSPALQQWFLGMDVAERYPEVDSIGFVELVPADQLAEFAAATWGRRVEPGGDVAAQLGIQPPGDRPEYCLGSAGVPGTNLYTVPIEQVDLCGGPLPAAGGGTFDVGPQLLDAARTGDAVISPRDVDGQQMLSLFLPVYAVGPAGQSRTFEGWVLALYRLDAVVAGALPASVDASLRLYAVGPDGAETLAAETGSVDHDDPDAVERVREFEVVGPWRLDMEVVPTTSAALANVVSVGLALLLLAVTGLMFALVRVLATSKDRAWELVRARTAELSHLALHDPLTGLPNRALVMDRLEHLLARARRRDVVPAALFIDLDGFKAVNDTFGHAAGDQLLVEAAARLRATVREAETVGRIGGDEFVVLLEQERDPGEAAAVAARVIEAFTEPFDLSPLAEESVVVGASVGVAMGLRDGADELLRDADVALYEAKAGGKGRFVLFRSEMQQALEARMRAELDLRRALEREELALLYVPIVDLRSGEVHSAEAVLDWHHPTIGPLTGDQLSEVVEDTGLAVPVGRWMLRRACQDAARFRTRSSIASVGVNVTTRHLLSEGFVDEVAQALADAGAPPASLVVELGESLLFGEPQAPARRIVDQLRELGVGVAAADFARRYTSLMDPSALPADALKIQPEFAVGVASSSESEVAVDTVIHLAHGLGVFVVAEGVTDPADLEALRRLGCDLVQGRAADSALGAGELLHRLGRPAGLDGDERPVS